MSSTEAQKRASIKWQKANYKRIPLDVQKEYYSDTLKPAADRAGESVNGYIKKAIAERIEREEVEPTAEELKAIAKADADMSELTPHEAINWE